MAAESASPSGLTKKDQRLVELFRKTVNYPDIKKAAHYLHQGKVYDLCGWMFLVRPPSPSEEHVMKPDTLYPYTGSTNKLAISEIREFHKLDPAVSLSQDPVVINGLWPAIQDNEFMVCKEKTIGACPNALLLLEDDNEGKTRKISRLAELGSSSSLLALPLRTYTFRTKYDLPAWLDEYKLSLRVFFPNCCPVLVALGDATVLVCVLGITANPLYPPIGYNGHFYQLDGWKEDARAFSRARKLKPKELKMNLPKPFTKPAAPPESATVEAPAEPLPSNTADAHVEDVQAENVTNVPEAPVKKPTLKRSAPKVTVPAPKPAPEPQAEKLQEAVDVLTERESREIIKAENAACAPVDAEPMGETTKDGYTAPPASQINTEPGPDAPAEKRRTRKAAPVVPVGFDFAPVIEYTGSALPEDLTADQIEAEARSLRDLGINIQRRQANLLFAMRKCGSASDAKLKALAELLGK